MELKENLEWSEDAKKLKNMPGILNYKNNCYANSAMQALFHLPPVYNHFERYSCSCGNNCVYCLMKNDFFNMIKSSCENPKDNNNIIEPKSLLNQLIEGNDIALKHGEMGDPMEFCYYLEDKMKETKEESPSENFLKDIFDCQPETVTRCKNCGSERKEKYFSSTFYIQNSIPESFAEKKCSGGKCGRESCQSSNLVEQNFVGKAPPALRFQIPREGNSKVTFPEKLEIGPYLKSNVPVMYELSSIVIHKPRLKHYIAMCREPCGKWNKYNDTVVRSCEIKHVLRQNPYAFFYRKTTADVGESTNPEEKRELTNEFKDLKVETGEESIGEMEEEMEGDEEETSGKVSGEQKTLNKIEVKKALDDLEMVELSEIKTSKDKSEFCFI